MRKNIFFMTILLSTNVFATPNTTSPALHQNLVSVDYTSNGKQSGCGLRATADNKDELSLNALITVFVKDTGATFGVIKVVARKINTKNGAPVLKHGNMTYLNLGKISTVWIQPDSVNKPKVYDQGSSHNDGYMETVDFNSTADLLLLLSQENFKIGFNYHQGQPDVVFTFNQWMDRREGNAFAACMANLNNVIEENKKQQSF
jgi:hypothetical protein